MKVVILKGLVLTDFKGNIIQSTDGRYGCLMVREHSFAGVPNNAG